MRWWGGRRRRAAPGGGQQLEAPEPRLQLSAIRAADGRELASLPALPSAHCVTVRWPSAASGLGFGKSKHRTKIPGVGFKVKEFWEGISGDL